MYPRGVTVLLLLGGLLGGCGEFVPEVGPLFDAAPPACSPGEYADAGPGAVGPYDTVTGADASTACPNDS